MLGSRGPPGVEGTSIPSGWRMSSLTTTDFPSKKSRSSGSLWAEAGETHAATRQTGSRKRCMVGMPQDTTAGPRQLVRQAARAA